ncbi:MAG: sugar kinase, partial [Spirochaeta sp.]
MSDSMIVLGIDCSTQSLSAAVLEIPRDVSGGAAPRTLFEQSVVFTQDPRTNAFGVDPDTLILPPQFPGQADQPPGMFLAALDAVLSDLQSAGAPLDRIAAIQISAQQHGHVYLSASAKEAFQSVASGACGKSLVEVFTDSYSYPSCPIWLTSSTKNEADDLRQRIGGKAAMIETSGSDSPLRFSGAVIRKVGLEFPKQYEETRAIRLLSAFLSGVLCGKMDVPADWGNASGTSLMDYRARDWSPQLIEAAAADLPGGSQALREKLGEVAHPLSWAGPIAQYFHERFGIPIDCKVGIGSGDNPQSKVGTSGDLLSLGTSFVFMIEQDTPSVDPQGFSNSMY